MENFDQIALALVIFVPLVGAILAMFMPADRQKDVWYFAIVVAGLSLILSVYIFVRYD